MTAESEKDDVVGIVTLQCSGADIKHKLQRPGPVEVVVDVERSGNRRVSCPFLKGMDYGDQTIFYCTATPRSLIHNNFHEVTELIAVKNAEEAKKEMPKYFPQCIHKYPL